MKIEKIDHLCFAVEDLDEAVKKYEDTLGLTPDLYYVEESEKVRVARYNVGEVAIELMESTSPDGEVAKFIRRHGEGFYLISYKVDDVEKSLQELSKRGKKLIDKEPRLMPGIRYAFLEPPQRLMGTLVEIIEGELDFESET